VRVSETLLVESIGESICGHIIDKQIMKWTYRLRAVREISDVVSYVVSVPYVVENFEQSTRMLDLCVRFVIRGTPSLFNMTGPYCG
jgi:hypothetical protein